MLGVLGVMLCTLFGTLFCMLLGMLLGILEAVHDELRLLEVLLCELYAVLNVLEAEKDVRHVLQVW